MPNQGSSLDTPPFFRKMAQQILRALMYLDGKQIIHRDIKPDNILFDDSDNFFITDFGSSKAQNFTMSVYGSPLYMAPEIFNRTQQTMKMDIWSLGVLILEVLDLTPRSPPETLGAMRRQHHEWHNALIRSAEKHLPQILPMFELDPQKRYSAKDCLEKIFTDSANLSLKDSKQDNSARISETRGAVAAQCSGSNIEQSQPILTVKVGNAAASSAASLASLPFALEISEGSQRTPPASGHASLAGSDSPRSLQASRIAGLAPGYALTEKNLRLTNELTCRTRVSPPGSLPSPIFRFELSIASERTCQGPEDSSHSSPQASADAAARQSGTSTSQSPPATRRSVSATSPGPCTERPQNPIQQAMPSLSGPLLSTTSQSPHAAQPPNQRQQGTPSASGTTPSTTSQSPHSRPAPPRDAFLQHIPPSGPTPTPSATSPNPGSRLRRMGSQTSTWQALGTLSPLDPAAFATPKSPTPSPTPSSRLRLRPRPARRQQDSEIGTPSPLGPSPSASTQSPSPRPPPATQRQDPLPQRTGAGTGTGTVTRSSSSTLPSAPPHNPSPSLRPPLARRQNSPQQRAGTDTSSPPQRTPTSLLSQSLRPYPRPPPARPQIPPPHPGPPLARSGSASGSLPPGGLTRLLSGEQRTLERSVSPGGPEQAAPR